MVCGKIPNFILCSLYQQIRNDVICKTKNIAPRLKQSTLDLLPPAIILFCHARANPLFCLRDTCSAQNMCCLRSKQFGV